MPRAMNANASTAARASVTSDSVRAVMLVLRACSCAGRTALGAHCPRPKPRAVVVALRAEVEPPPRAATGEGVSMPRISARGKRSEGRNPHRDDGLSPRKTKRRYQHQAESRPEWTARPRTRRPVSWEVDQAVGAIHMEASEQHPKRSAVCDDPAPFAPPTPNPHHHQQHRQRRAAPLDRLADSGVGLHGGSLPRRPRRGPMSPDGRERGGAGALGWDAVRWPA
jgi:hypothetical protein